LTKIQKAIASLFSELLKINLEGEGGLKALKLKKMAAALNFAQD